MLGLISIFNPDKIIAFALTKSLGFSTKYKPKVKILILKVKNHMQAKLDFIKHFYFIDRNTPARAGKTRAFLRRGPGAEDHPRACG